MLLECNLYKIVNKEREPIIRQAKRAAIVQQLAELRESSPDVPMVSVMIRCYYMSDR